MDIQSSSFVGLEKVGHKSLLKNLAVGLCLVTSASALADSAQYYVSTNGSDDTGDGSIDNPWLTVQKALYTVPFDVDAADINLREGTYILSSTLYIDEFRGGSESGVFRIKNYDEEVAILDGTNIGDYGAMITVASAHYVAIEGVELTNLIGNKTGIQITGDSSNIDIHQNRIYNMHWTVDEEDAGAPESSDNLNPVVILGNQTTPLSSISFTENTMFNLTTGWSEAVKVVGNVDGFLIEDNTIYDVTNICIVAAGNYDWVGLSDAELNHARNGIIRNNETADCVSPIAASAGIYADGARNLLIADNYSHHNTVGFSIGSEQPGDASGIILTGNNATYNTQAGLVLGTFTDGATVSGIQVTKNKFLGNYTDTVYGGAPIIFSNAENVTISHNDISSINQYMITASGSVSNLNINRNNYESTLVDETEAVFAWGGISGEDYYSFESYQLATGHDNRSSFEATE